MSRSPIAVGLDYDVVATSYDGRFSDRRKAVRFRTIDRPQLEISRRRHRVLELGCGTGRLLIQCQARVRIGIDVSARMLRCARQRGLPVAKSDAHQLPFADESFDAIIAGNGVFRYLDYHRAFAECARVLRDGGQLAVHQYAANTWSLRKMLDRRTQPHPGHVRSLADIVGPAEQVGLEIVRKHFWRAVRVAPYAVAIPPWMPGRLWDHCTVVFRK